MADGDRDVVDCGTGRDTVYVEADAPTRDVLRRCETVVQIPAEPSTDAPPSSNNIIGTAVADVLNGTPGKDTILGGDGADQLFGNEGDDYVDGENGDDTVRGGPGNDELYGRFGNDLVLGNEGDDRLNGDRGNDTLNGGPGNDTIFGGFDDDVIAGEDGDDRIQVVGLGVDRVDCGEGIDTVYAGPEDIVAANCENVRIYALGEDRQDPHAGGKPLGAVEPAHPVPEGCRDPGSRSRRCQARGVRARPGARPSSARCSTRRDGGSPRR